MSVVIFSYLMKREQITERTQVTQERAQEYKAEHKLDGRENTILRISQCHKMERMEHCNGNRNEQVIKFEKLPWKRLIAWIIVQMTYTLLGAFLFIYVEECKGKRTNDTSKYQSFSKYLNNKDGIDQGEKERILNLTKSFFVITEERICKINHDTIAKWWQFTTVTCYTIGYGRITPKTEIGKMTTIVYAAFGIPLSIAMYTTSSELITKAIRNLICFIETKCLKRQDPRGLTAKTFFAMTLVFVVFFFSVSCVNTVKKYGNLTMIDSTYYWFQTLTTIGYGDVYPNAEHDDLMQFITKLLHVFGLGIIASLITAAVKLVTEINGKKIGRVLSFGQRSWSLGRRIQESKL